MTQSHESNMLQHIKHDIEKILVKGELENEEERMQDMLTRVSEVTMTAELITKSGLGETIASVREKFNFSTKIPELARAILLSWRTIMKTSKGKAAPAKSGLDAGKKALPAPESAASPPPNTVMSPPKPAESSAGRKNNLPSERRPIYTVFHNIFKSAISSQQADQIALDIEEALHTQNQGNLKQYSAKAKTIAFNLNKNKHLKELVRSGSLPCAQLVTLTAAELASSDIKAQRELLNSQALDSRRLDWLEEHKTEIQLDIGVDPANQWQYDNEDDKLSEPDADQPDV